MDKIKRPLYQKHPMAKFSWTVTEETDTIEWYNSCLNALKNVDKLSQEKDVADIIQSKVIQILNGKDEDLKLQWEKDLKFGDLSGVHAECLTDTWIGKDRWAFIDLSAGPFSWGPAVGGEGVRTYLSLPNVENTIGAVAESSEEEAENSLARCDSGEVCCIWGSEHSFKAFQAHERQLVDKYNYVVSRWKRISTVVGELRFVDALRLLTSLEDASKGLCEHYGNQHAPEHQIYCTKQRKVKVELDLTTIPAFAVVVFVLWMVLKPRRSKAKIN